MSATGTTESVAHALYADASNGPANRGRIAIAAAQARLHGQHPRVHPNGFIQLDLTHDPDSRIAHTRLHVWPDGDDIPRQETATTIHDHRFDMRSQVLLGMIVQRRYMVEISPTTWGDDHPFTHEIHVATYPTPKESVLTPTGVRARVTSAGYKWVSEGESYVQSRYTFHDTRWVGLTATLMTKTAEDRRHEPRVLVPLGKSPDNDFVRAEADEGLLWDYIERALTDGC